MKIALSLFPLALVAWFAACQAQPIRMPKNPADRGSGNCVLMKYHEIAYIPAFTGVPRSPTGTVEDARGPKKD